MKTIPRGLLILLPIGVFVPIMLWLAWQNQPCIPSASPTVNLGQPDPSVTMYVPIDFIVASGTSAPINYDDSQIHAFLGYSNLVWSKAGIVFEAESIKYITVPDWRATPMRMNMDLCNFGKDYLGADFEDQTIDVIYVKDFLFHFDDTGGGLTLNKAPIGAAFIEEFADDYRANHTLSHELGHALNLVHVLGTENLMYDAVANPGILTDRSTSLTDEQIAIVREYVFANRCPELSCIRE